jgi:hypothetical protein
MVPKSTFKCQSVAKKVRLVIHTDGPGARDIHLSVGQAFGVASFSPGLLSVAPVRGSSNYKCELIT